MDNFCKNCRFLLEPNSYSNKLKYKCDKCGETVDAEPTATMLINEDLTASDRTDKYKHTIATTAYDPISAKIFIPEGCSKCKRTVASYQLLGEKKNMVIVCLCGEVS
jgi:DNA-directed RNA polymerase subunit M/transcription elongation factor TFIIS